MQHANQGVALKCCWEYVEMKISLQEFFLDIILYTAGRLIFMSIGERKVSSKIGPPVAYMALWYTLLSQDGSTWTCWTASGTPKQTGPPCPQLVLWAGCYCKHVREALCRGSGSGSNRRLSNCLHKRAPVSSKAQFLLKGLC